jgi:hypothetical protein
VVSLDDKGVTFKWKDCRLDGPERYKQMTLDPHEFIRRFLMHVLPQGFPPHPRLSGIKALKYKDNAGREQDGPRSLPTP